MSQELEEKVARAIAAKWRDADQDRAVAAGNDVFIVIDAYLPMAREFARAALAVVREEMAEPTLRQYRLRFKNSPASAWTEWRDGQPENLFSIGRLEHFDIEERALFDRAMLSASPLGRALAIP